MYYESWKFRFSVDSSIILWHIVKLFFVPSVKGEGWLLHIPTFSVSNMSRMSNDDSCCLVPFASLQLLSFLFLQCFKLKCSPDNRLQTCLLWIEDFYISSPFSNHFPHIYLSIYTKLIFKDGRCWVYIWYLTTWVE